MRRSGIGSSWWQIHSRENRDCHPSWKNKLCTLFVNWPLLSSDILDNCCLIWKTFLENLLRKQWGTSCREETVDLDPYSFHGCVWYGDNSISFMDILLQDWDRECDTPGVNWYHSSLQLNTAPFWTTSTDWAKGDTVLQWFFSLKDNSAQ